LGLYGTIDENLPDTAGVVLIPVSDEKAFVELVEQVSHSKPKKEDDGSYVLAPDNSPVSVYFRFAHKYAYVTAKEKAAIDKTKLLEPETVFGRDASATLAATFNLDRIPESLKQIVLGQLELRLAAVEEEKSSEESASGHQLKAQTAKEAAKGLSTLLQDGGALKIRLNVDRDKNLLSAEASLAGKPDSKLAAGIAGLKESTSLFAGLLDPDAAVNVLLHAALPANLRLAFSSAVESEIAKGLSKEKDSAKRAEGEKVVK